MVQGLREDVAGILANSVRSEGDRDIQWVYYIMVINFFCIHMTFFITHWDICNRMLNSDV